MAWKRNRAKKRGVRVVRSTQPTGGDDLKAAYSDICQTTFDRDHVRITFGLGTGPGKPAETVARVVVSPRHLKALVEMFQKTLRDYEQHNGHIGEGLIQVPDLKRAN